MGILHKLGFGDGSFNGAGGMEQRRRFLRYPGDGQVCVAVRGGVYPVRDWSQGGIFMATGGDIGFNLGDFAHFDLTFDFPHEQIKITQQGQVVRLERRGAAIAFLEPGWENQRLFKRAVDAYNTQGFMQSTVA